MRRPYPSYRNSGVEWLGQVPEHWVVCPLKRVLARNDGGVWGDDPDDDTGTVVLRSTEQTIDGSWSITNPAHRRLSFQERKEALLAKGDLVVTKSSGSALHIGKTSLVTDRVAQLEPCFSNFMQRLRCLSEFEPRLAWYLINSHMGRQQLVYNSNTTTGLANLNGTILGNLLFAMPPPVEQRSIAAFLDHETAKIDSLVERKRLLLDRLAEYRTALITRTVTKGLPPEAAREAGLNPTQRFKHSGVEWLGAIPEHWGLARLKWSSIRSANGVWGEEANGEDDLACVRVADFDRRRLRVSMASPTLRAIPASQRVGRELMPGDLLMEKSGGGEHQLVGCVVLYDHDVPAVCSNFIARVSVSEDADPRYWNYLHAAVYSARLNYPAIKQTTGIQNLDADAYFNILSVFPPLDEQRAIASFLDAKTNDIETLTSRTELAIERLQEHRTALITAAVTGKIDVRELEQVQIGASRT